MTAEAEESFLTWMKMWEDGIVQADDVADALAGIIKSSGDVSFLSRAPIVIQTELLRQLAVFRELGCRVVVVPQTGIEIDRTRRFQVCFQTLLRGGIL